MVPPGTMVGLPAGSGTVVASIGTPVVIIGPHPGSHVGAQGGAQGSQAAPRFLRQNREPDSHPVSAVAATMSTSVKNVSLFIAYFSAQATCINHGDCRPHNSTPHSTMCKFNR